MRVRSNKCSFVSHSTRHAKTAIALGGWRGGEGTFDEMRVRQGADICGTQNDRVWGRLQPGSTGLAWHEIWYGAPGALGTFVVATHAAGVSITAA